MVGVRVLGKVEVVAADGAVVPVSAPALQRVLCQLTIVAPATAWREAIEDAIWPDGSPASSESAMRNMMSRLRRLFGSGLDESPVVHQGHGYGLHRTVEVDASAFERGVVALRRAPVSSELVQELDTLLALWRGEPYGGLATEPFRTETDRLELLRVQALQQRQEALLALGRAAEGIDDMMAALDRHPYHEGLIEQLLASSYLCGDGAGALALYARKHDEFAADLGATLPDAVVRLGAVIQRNGAVRGRRPPRSPQNTSALVGQAVATSLASDMHSAATLPAPGRLVLLCQRADANAFLGQFDEAAAGYLEAADVAADTGDMSVVGELCLRLATVTWDPDLGARVAALIDKALESIDDPLLGAQLRICRHGGLYRSGTEGQRDETPDVADLGLVARHGSALQIAWATTRFRNGLAGTLAPTEALEQTRRIRELDVVDPLIIGHNERATFADSLRAGLRSRALHELLTMERRASPAEPAVNRFGWITARNCWDLAMGRFSAVKAGLAGSAAFRGQLGQHTLDQVVLGQSFWLTHELSNDQAAGAHFDAALGLAEADKTSPLWLVAAATLAVDLEEPTRAAEIIAEADSTYGLATLPPGGHLLPVISMAAEVMARVGGFVDLAAAMYERLDLAPERGVLVGWPTLFLGSKERFLALAAHGAGENERAAQHMHRALFEDRWTPALLAHSLSAAGLIFTGEDGARYSDRAQALRKHLSSR